EKGPRTIVDPGFNIDRKEPVYRIQPDAEIQPVVKAPRKGDRTPAVPDPQVFIPEKGPRTIVDPGFLVDKKERVRVGVPEKDMVYLDPMERGGVRPEVLEKQIMEAKKRIKSRPQDTEGSQEEVERITGNALDDLRGLKSSLAGIPAGSERQAEESLDRAQGVVDKAKESLKELGGGDHSAQLKSLEASLKEFRDLAKQRSKDPGPGVSSSGGEAENTQAIQGLYQRFAAAFASKDLAAILNCLTEDWESAEGTGLSDMESTLNNSFSVFDTVRMEVQNLQIRPLGQGKFQASYSTHMTGNIRQNDIKHEEKSTHTDTIVFTKDGPRILRTSGKTGWVQ
ncbi:MAG: nuclear transport factor 2 family protein, partial [Elusimicrobia bacterium]|nr:nuclear transport factor 2 family protein [Elusimicrobiota bacterium]